MIPKHQTPLVSVLMAAYNAEEYIGRAIESVLNQTYSNLELIILNDGSTDSTQEIIERYCNQDPRIRGHTSATNRGYLVTCNALFEKASGVFITTQDADDLSEADRIERQVLSLSDSGALVSIPGYSRIDEDGHLLSTVTTLPPESELLLVGQRFPWCYNAVMIHRVVYNCVGGYNSYFDRAGCEDAYWFFSMAMRYNVTCLNEALYTYRVNTKSITTVPRAIKQFYISDIVDFLIRQQHELGSDSLTNPDLREKLVTFEEHLRSRLEQIPYFLKYVELYRAIMARAYARTIEILRKQPLLLARPTAIIKATQILLERKRKLGIKKKFAKAAQTYRNTSATNMVL